MDTPTNEPNNQEPVHQRFMNHKLASVAIAVAVLALATGIAFWQKAAVVPPTPTIPFDQEEETAGWKTYTNTQYGFEVKYPTGWKMDGPNVSYAGATPAGTSISLTSSTHPEYPQSGYGVVNFDIIDKYSGPSLENQGCLSDNIKNQTCFSEFRVVNNNRWLVTTFVVAEGEGSGLKEKTAELISGGKIYTFYTGCCGLPQNETLVNLAQNNSDIDQILSTFKFTGSADATANCSGQTSTDEGGSAYPTSAKYSALGGLGIYFTAEDCSPSRLAEVVKNQYPHYGEHVVLSRSPSSPLIAVLKQVGLTPSPEKCANISESSCMDWRPLKESDFIPANIVQLRPFIDFIKFTDCYFCG